MKYSYTSALRVNTTNLGGLERNLSRYSGGFDEVFFFSQYTHSVKNLEHHRAEAEKIRPYLRKLREMGITAGINVLATTVFFPEALDRAMENAKLYFGLDGRGLRKRFT